MARRPGLCAQLPGGCGLATGGCALEQVFSDLFGWDDGYIMVYLVGGVEHLDYFSIFGGGGWECHNPN